VQAAAAGSHRGNVVGLRNSSFSSFTQNNDKIEEGVEASTYNFNHCVTVNRHPSSAPSSQTCAASATRALAPPEGASVTAASSAATGNQASLASNNWRRRQKIPSSSFANFEATPLPYVDMPLQFNFGSTYASSLTIFFDNN